MITMYILNEYGVLREGLNRSIMLATSGTLEPAWPRKALSLAAYYQCHKHYRAVDHVLYRFRHFYPTAPVVMVNDGGDHSLEELAHKYQADYQYQEKSSDNAKLYFTDVNKATTFVKHIMDTAKLADWVLLLEDDVWMFNQITPEAMKFDINGMVPQQFRQIFIDLSEEMLGKPVTSGTRYGANGGSVLRSSFLQKVADSKDWVDRVAQICNVSTHLASDELLSTLLFSYGATLGDFDGYIQREHIGSLELHTKIKEHRAEVIHEEKSLYD